MKRTVARTLPLFALALAFSAQGLAQTKPKTAKSQATKPATAQKVDDGNEIGEKLITEILSKVARPRIQLRVNMGNDGAMNELKARTEIPLKGEVIIPLGGKSNNPQADKLMPTAALKTAGLVVRWNANTDEKGNHISNHVTFHDKAGNPVPLIITLRSELTDLLDLRIESLTMEAEGIKKDAPAVQIKASCKLKQSLVDLTTGKITWEDTTCTFNGKYVREAKEGAEKFTYRFVFDSF